MRKLIIFGASGHADVVADIAMKNGYEIEGFLDDNESISEVIGIKKIGKVSDCLDYKDSCDFAIGIGNNAVRKKIFETYPDLNYVTLIHPTASIGINVEIKKGTVVMPMTVVNACATIGDFTLIAPNATVCGVCNIGNEVYMGAGSVVKQVINICDNVTTGSGSVIVKDITEPGTYIGVPVKKIN